MTFLAIGFIILVAAYSYASYKVRMSDKKIQELALNLFKNLDI